MKEEMAERLKLVVQMLSHCPGVESAAIQITVEKDGPLHECGAGVLAIALDRGEDAPQNMAKMCVRSAFQLALTTFTNPVEAGFATLTLMASLIEAEVAERVAAESGAVEAANEAIAKMMK